MKAFGMLKYTCYVIWYSYRILDIHLAFDKSKKGKKSNKQIVKLLPDVPRSG